MKKMGKVLAGRYRLLEVIGEGRVTTIYRALDQRLDRDAAVKFLRPPFSLDRTFVAAFRREMHLAMQLDHPCIEAIYDRGTDSGIDYIVTQLAGRSTLATTLARERTISLEMALHIGLQTTKALQAAHERGIAHGGLTPASIHLDPDGDVRVDDFGIAAAVRDTRDGRSEPDPAWAPYASPERVLGEPATNSSDIYALGVMLYDAVTGRRPFAGESDAEITADGLRALPFPPSSVTLGLRLVDRVILEAMARDPRHRYLSAAEFGAAIERFRMLELGDVRRGDAFGLMGVVAHVPVMARERIAAPAPGGLPSGEPVAIRGAEALRAPTQAAAPVVVGAEAVVVGVDAVAVIPAVALGATVPVAVAEAVGPVESVVPRVAVASGRETFDGGGRRRLVPFLASALAIGIGLFGVGLVGGTIGERGAVLSASGTPRTSDPGLVAILPPSPVAAPIPSPAPSESPPPTSNSTTSASPAVGGGPAEVAALFFDLVEAGRRTEAVALWTARMTAEYPGDSFFTTYFDTVTSIDISDIRVESITLANTAAFVSFDVTQHRASGPDRRLVGTWRVVIESSGWRLDDLHT